MEIKVAKCRKCGRIAYIIPSNNPLHDGDICIDCINETIDPRKLEHFAFFCRTYNFPANVNLYIACLKNNPKLAIKEYVQQLYNNGNLEYNDATTDKWKEVSQEWEKVKTHRQLLEKIEPLKRDFILRCGEKWGKEYTFEQYLKLESQFTSMIRTLNLSNPTQLDTLKKYCKLSILVDDMISGGEIKAISDGTTALSKLADLANIQELSETASEGTIKTVADLYKYMEDHGFIFNYYDQVDRDIVDKTIKDIQQSIRTEINNAVGLDVTLQQIKENYNRQEEEINEKKIQDEVKLEDLLDLDDYSKEDQAIDEELASEDIIFED